ncbi:MAG: flagellar M-ring protein FliF [Candidatus Adiutrix sp.]|jgi:flagellar M-ring protein FliF|nr:flagellar M-ring protein FliF [Candidatus Adiutrix sp.]
MAFNFQDRLNRGREIIVAAGPSKLAVSGLLIAAAAALLLFIIFRSSGSEMSYGVLYSQLSPEDAGAITNELKAQKVPYNLVADGTAIEVPAELVSATRVDLAVKGLPSKSNVGFEIFDNQKLGVTDLVQKTNLMRAVSGELERTITSMPEIEMARVHLSVPKETLFIEEQKDPTASVVIKMRRGAELTKPQLNGLVNLVTSSVAGLTPDNVSVVDTDGGLIWSKDTNKPGLLNDDQMAQKSKYEEAIKRRIQAMMERVVGHDKAITTVHADLDLKEVVTSEDIFDPERTAVRSEQKIVEKSVGPGRYNAGVPNATYELGTANRQNSGVGGQDQYTRTEEQNNYEVTNTKRQTVSKAGDLKKISVAVLLDGLYVKNEEGETVFEPQSPEKLQLLEEAVKAAIGFDAARGDIVSITSAQFARPEEISPWALFALDLVREFAHPLINILLIILFFFLVVRPIVNWLKREVEPAGAGAEPPILPELPGGPSYGDSLPLPAAASPAPLAAAGEETDELPDKAYSPADENEAPDYEDEADEDDEETPALAYGNLSRDNILPIARDNLERTVGLVRSWIEEKPPQGDEHKM